MSMQAVRIFLIVLLVSWRAIAGAEGREVQAYPPAGVDMELKQVSPHVWFVEGVAGVATDNAGFVSNAGVIVTGAGVVVFDALGTPSLADLLLKTSESGNFSRPLRKASSTRKLNPTNSAPESETMRAAALAVPPVANKSSTTSTR